MGARINRQPTDPVWIEIGFGVALLCRLFSPTADMAASRAFVATYARNVEEGRAPNTEAVADVEETIAWAREAVIDWRGVTDDAGAPLPFAWPDLDLMLRQGLVDEVGGVHTVLHTFKLAFEIKRRAWRAEGEASAVAPNGIGGATADAPSVVDAGT